MNKTLFKPDRILIVSVAILVVFGWIFLYSASAMVAESKFQDQYHFLRKQMVWSVFGLISLILMMNFPHNKFQNLSRPLIALTMILLALVLFIGHEVNGAQRWIRFFGFGFQPSEIAKLTVIIFLADYIDRKRSRLIDFQNGLFPVLGIVGMVMLLIFFQPDLGTALLIGLVMMTLLFIAGARPRHLFQLFLFCLPFLYFTIFHVAYRRQRLLSFLSPWSDSLGSGYQLTQSLIALGSGGMWGKGIGQSAIKMHYLPEVPTDFIFSILGEELGLLGTLTIIILFSLIAWRGLSVGKRAPNLFGQLLAIGLTLMIVFQAFINIGVVTGLFPTKGIPLPFLSFGGSSLFVSLTAIGILLNISRYTTVQVDLETRFRGYRRRHS